MNDLDSIIDNFEDAVSRNGLLHTNPRDFVSGLDRQSVDPDLGEQCDNRIIVELLRVWIELRWRAFQETTVADALANFPDVQFSKEDRQSLQYEEDRQRRLAELKSSDRHETEKSLELLPSVGDSWGEFRLIHLLGEGAFAKVFLARQVGMADRSIVLKLTFRETQESFWLSKLQHSAVVPIYSVHRIADVFGICMPYLGNTTLADLLNETTNEASHFGRKRDSTRSRRSKRATDLMSTLAQRHALIETLVQDTEITLPFNQTASIEADLSSPTVPTFDALSGPGIATKLAFESEILWIGWQVAEGIAYAHRHGILHCDIKPANVLLASDGQPRLLDFNVAHRSQEPKAEIIPVGGTLPYMSPEQLRSMKTLQPIDGRSDIYSLGVVLFELLTGVLPNKNLQSDPSNPRQASQEIEGNIRRLNPSVSAATRAIIAKCLSPSIERRYENAGQLRDDLKAQACNLPLVHLAEPSLIERVQKWGKRHPRLSSTASVTMLACLLFSFGLGMFLWRGRALRESEWNHQFDNLANRMPRSMSLITSLEVAPQLRADLLQDLHQTFSICTSTEPKVAIVPGWNERLFQSGREGLCNDLQLLIGIAEGQPWRKGSPLESNQLKMAQLVELQTEAIAAAMRGRTETRSQLISTDTARWIRNKNWKEGREILEQTISSNPHNYAANCLLGNCYIRLHEPERAIQAFSSCIALRPDISTAFFNRAAVHFAQKRWLLAVEDYGQTIKINPTWNWARLNRSISLQRQGRFQEAIDEINLAIEAGIKEVSHFRLRAELNGQIGNAERQRQDLEAALACIPSSDQDWIDHGLILLATNPKQSCEDFEQASRINPDSIDAHQKLAYVYSELLGDRVKALKHLQKLIELAPTEATHRAGRAVLLARSRDWRDALKDLEVCAQLNPTDAIVQYQIACGYCLIASSIKATDSVVNVDINRVGQFNRTCLDWFSRAIQLDPSIAQIVMGDPDMDGMKMLPEFQKVMEAHHLLHSPSPPPVKQSDTQ